MATDTQSENVFMQWYRNRIGEPTTDDEARGYWVFALGMVLGIVGILLFTQSGSPSTLREYSIILAAVGLVLLLAGPLIRLPLERTANVLVYLGVVVSAAAVVWFYLVYPVNWRAEADGIILLYSAGILGMALGGIFVPLLTPGRKYEEEIEFLEGELDELRAALADAESDESDLADIIEHLRQEQEDTAADEADLAAQLRTFRSSQARFELYEDTDEQWRWRLRHRNGNVIADSNQGYTRQHNAQKGMQSVRRNALGATLTLIESEDDLPAEDEEFVPVEEIESQATFEFYEDNAGEWRWRLRHDNGNIISDGGQGYASKSGVQTAIERIRDHVGPANYLRFDPTGFEIYPDAAGEWRWRLVHRNGNILADGGEGYSRRHDARRAVDRIREHVDDMEFEIYEDAAGDSRWRLFGRNSSEIVADSGEGYTDRSEAEAAVERVREYAPDADALDIGQAAFELYEDNASEWRWRLRHRNGNVVADGSQGYADRTRAREGIASVKRNAPNAESEAV